jgi:calcium/calmodulin-dependent protein kinase (CaM kinase) II
MPDSTADELLHLTQRLLDCIAAGDWPTYQELCDPSLTAVEPESHGLLVEGLAFHRFYFDLGGIRGRSQTTMAAPHVRVMGDAAVVTYQRLVQRVGADGVPVTAAHVETRVWQRRDGRWRNVHFHRTPLAM